MSGTIVKTGNRHRAFFSYGGKRISKYFATKQDAENWLAKCQTELATGIFIEPSKMTVGEWAVEYLATYAKPQVKPSTFLRLKKEANRLEPIANLELQKLTAFHIQKLINSCSTAAKRKTLFTLINQLLNKAVKIRIIYYNPCNSLDVPRYQPPEKQIFTQDEISRILPEIKKHRHGNIFLTMFATGCRIGEVLGLKIENIFNDHIHISGTIGTNSQDYYDTPKTSSSVRDISVPPFIINILREEYTKTSALSPYVFANKQGNHYTGTTAQKWWGQILTSANVPFRSTHTIRHTHATQLLQDFNYIEVQHRLGHARASTTLNTYGHLVKINNEKMSQVVEKIIGSDF